MGDNIVHMTMKNKRMLWTVLGVAAVVLVVWAITHVSKSARTLTASVVYMCDGGKTISAAYYEGKVMDEAAPGEMPHPTGTVDVAIGETATTTLRQTVSASGVRYANSDESLVFWNKGDEALVMRNNAMDLAYTNCSSEPKKPVVEKPSQNTSAPVACTMEALLCPDGSGVGRSGPKCEFAACPNSASAYTGEVRMQGTTYVLVVPAAPNAGTGVTYALPLNVTGMETAAHALIGRTAVVQGSFSAGNTLKVTSITAFTGDVTLGTLSVGETKYVNGIMITLNRIVEDSRCPQNVQCIQAGRVVAEVALRSDTDRETVKISSLDTPAHQFDTFKVSLVGVAPEKTENVFPSTNSYRLTFKVQK